MLDGLCRIEKFDRGVVKGISYDLAALETFQNFVKPFCQYIIYKQIYHQNPTKADYF